ncbi:MAG: PaaI family thioesterase [Bernardetiaceae bacterium]
MIDPPNSILQFEQQLAALKAAGLNVPAPAYTHFGGELLALVPDERIRIAFPLKAEQENPTGNTLGGMLAVFFDLAYGPFSYFVARGPAVSLDLNTTFVRPLSTTDARVEIEVWLIEQSKSYLLMEGKAYKSDGRLVATSTSRMQKL